MSLQGPARLLPLGVLLLLAFCAITVRNQLALFTYVNSKSGIAVPALISSAMACFGSAAHIVLVLIASALAVAMFALCWGREATPSIGLRVSFTAAALAHLPLVIWATASWILISDVASRDMSLESLAVVVANMSTARALAYAAAVCCWAVFLQVLTRLGAVRAALLAGVPASVLATALAGIDWLFGMGC
jgi:hypothetical protein